jgi:cell division protein FtsX
VIVFISGFCTNYLEFIMKGFVISFLTSIVILTAVFFPSIQAAPMEIMPRILVYLSFPLAVGLNMAYILLGHLMGWVGSRDHAGQMQQQLSH